jgi:hypothetical protein
MARASTGHDQTIGPAVADFGEPEKVDENR